MPLDVTTMDILDYAQKLAEGARAKLAEDNRRFEQLRNQREPAKEEPLSDQ